MINSHLLELIPFLDESAPLFFHLFRREFRLARVLRIERGEGPVAFGYGLSKTFVELLERRESSLELLVGVSELLRLFILALDLELGFVENGRYLQGRLQVMSTQE